MICDTLITAEERASHVQECCLGRAASAFPQLGVVLLEHSSRQEGALLYSDRKAETNGLFALGRYLFASLTITMIIMAVSWFPVELNEFFPPFISTSRQSHSWLPVQLTEKLMLSLKNTFSLLEHRM